MGLRFSFYSVVFILALVALGQSCTKPTLIGSDLLDEEIADLGFTDTFRMRMVTRVEDSIIIHSSSGGPQVIKHLCGKLDDPIFGKSEAEISTQMFLNGVGRDFLENTIDSVVLHLAYDETSNMYGDLSEPVTVEAFRIFTVLDNTESYYSNFRTSQGFFPMGVKENFIPQPMDSLTLIRGEDTTVVPPQLRIPINQDFINAMLEQTPGTYEFSDSFRLWFDGVKIRMSEGTNTMLSFDLASPFSGMTVYYSDVGAENLAEYRFVFLGAFFEQVQLVSFDHEYAGAAIEPFIDDLDLGDSLAFVQSMSGVNTEVEIIGLDQMEDVLINQAELEVFVADVPGDDTELYPPIERLATREFNDNGQLINGVDVRLALNVQEISVFGGLLMATDTAGVSPRKYVMNVTNVVQDIVSGRQGNQIFISSFLKQNQPHRVVMYGPGHPTYAPRLRLTFTRVR
ncbi:MAG: DUF4270 family protein [Saprospiraceae bacterium]|nr:DUF4270 family protein [Saprospiraceae bacterium]